MSAQTVILLIVVLSVIAPFLLRLYRSPLVWITLLIVNAIIITVFVVVRESAPSKISHRSDPGSISTPAPSDKAPAPAR